MLPPIPFNPDQGQNPNLPHIRFNASCQPSQSHPPTHPFHPSQQAAIECLLTSEGRGNQLFPHKQPMPYLLPARESLNTRHCHADSQPAEEFTPILPNSIIFNACLPTDRGCLHPGVTPIHTYRLYTDRGILTLTVMLAGQTHIETLNPRDA
jgi:hypothetical protein